jgi:glycosyltransferase involved in cell wall biosynthesis
MNKKKVCMIVYSIYPFDARVRREAETLALSGNFEVTVLCLKEDSQPKSYYKENVKVKELNVRKYIGNNKLLYVLSHLRFFVKAFWACSKLFVMERIDIIHIHNMPNFLVFAAIIPKIFRKPVVLDMHDSVPDTFEAKFTNGAKLFFKILCLEERLSAWMSDKVICVNHVQKEVTVQRGIPSEKIYISMNVPDHRKFPKRENQHNPTHKKDDKFRVVYHGTFTERLGIDLAIEAIRKLKKQIPGLELHLWGRGDYLDSLRSQCKDSGDEKLVFFRGMVPIERLSDVLAEMDLGIIPNRRSEATDLMLPVKLMEYIALEIPVIAPKLKAIQYYFSDQMVSFFAPGNIDEMAQAIFKIYLDETRGKSQNENAKGFLEKYGWEKQSVDFINFYLGI